MNPEARVPEETTIPFSKAESETGSEKESPVTKSGSGKIRSQIKAPEVTTTKAVESGMVININEEAPVSCSKEEPEKGGEKENQVISSGSGRIESQIRVPEVTTTKASESGPVMKKNEEAPMPCSEEDPEKGCEEENQVISSGSGRT